GAYIAPPVGTVKRPCTPRGPREGRPGVPGNLRAVLRVGAQPLPPTPSPKLRGGARRGSPSVVFSPSPLRGGGWGEGFAHRHSGWGRGRTGGSRTRQRPVTWLGAGASGLCGRRRPRPHGYLDGDSFFSSLGPALDRRIRFGPGLREGKPSSAVKTRDWTSCR